MKRITANHYQTSERYYKLPREYEVCGQGRNDSGIRL